MNFITLTKYGDSSPVYICPAFIAALEIEADYSDGHTRVVLSGVTTEYLVNETPEQINEIIKNSWKDSL